MASVSAPYSSTAAYFARHGLDIRPSADSDFGHLVKIMLHAYREVSRRIFERERKDTEGLRLAFFGEDEQDPSRRVFYTVEDSGAVVGSGGILQYDPEENPDIGYLSFVCLKPPYRRKGLGEALTRDLLRKAKRLRFERVRLLTRVEFEAAVCLYIKLGFRRARTQDFKGKYISLEKRISSLKTPQSP
jgi:ribosomal protein S18 acetylase RimI-like enzyme